MFLRLFLILLLSTATVRMYAQDAYREAYIERTKKAFTHTVQDFYGINDRYTVEASYRLKKRGKTISVPTSSDQLKTYKEYAIVTFRLNGRKNKLTVYQAVPVSPLYRDHLFLPLKDLTAPHHTYGGGRYLDLSISDFSGGRVTLDFNRLYNPLCAFSDGWNCPIPPSNNHLKISLEAGEKRPLQTEYDQN